ncbi:MAG: Methylcobalamin:coenzyme M methyltransferase MtbA [Candidatus Methanohalarchaeum thermophilum]|uniref:Methylcobalamin:coenzyme M methyltransferase MtbA n=1 Tax=Methanohalarchaeum thermophilum TaxID=1903181 RepID=A0A1Q6DRY6_METT1|nr:MAG: Methylcobalamin:coenzyme M methyltransferase MtbA [Candidatus Methanohalarchaeum thermophilum]
MKNEMTHLKRSKVALKGDKPDKVPVFSRDLTFPLDVVDYTTPEVCKGGAGGTFDAEKSAEAVIKSQEEIGHDVVLGSVWDLGLASDVYGGETKFPEYGIPRVDEAAFSDNLERVEDVDPINFREDGRYPGVLESYEIVSEEIGDEVGIAVNIQGPVTEACLMRGTEKLLMDMMERPDLAKELIDLATTNIKNFIEECFEAGANLTTFLAASNDGTEVLTPQFMREFSLPKIKEIVEFSHDLGYPVVFHPHGVFTEPEHHELVDKSISTGIDGFQFAEDNDYEFAAEKWGEDVCILGGVSIKDAILPGPVSKIENEVKKRLKDCAKDGGYIAMAACSLHRDTPVENVRAMTEATHKYGEYPINL